MTNRENCSFSTLWIEKYLKIKNNNEVMLDSDPIVKEIRDFLLLWNLYERLFMDCQSTVKKVWNNNNHFKPDLASVTGFFTFIIKRYSDSEMFNKLNFAHDDKSVRESCKPYSERVFDILRKDNPSEEEMTTVCLMVAWRYRNNLFHGKKKMVSFWAQKEIFVEVNAFLISGLSNKTGVKI